MFVVAVSIASLTIDKFKKFLVFSSLFTTSGIYVEAKTWDKFSGYHFSIPVGNAETNEYGVLNYKIDITNQ